MQFKTKKLGLLILSFFLLYFFSNQKIAFATEPGYWKSISPMNTPRTVHGVAKIGNNLLVAGGYSDGKIIKSSEIYFPSTNLWKKVGDMNSPRMLFGTTYMVTLDDERVITTNGEGPEFVKGAADTEIFNPITETWSTLASSNTGRYRGIFISIPNNKILLAGGNNGSSITSSSEIYDISSNTWSYSSNMITGREGTPSVGTLTDGKIIIAGGFNGSADDNTAEIFNPSTEDWSQTILPFTMNNGNIITLDDGRVLAISINGVAILNSDQKTWNKVKEMNTPRRSAGSFLLSDGRVLVYGGSNNEGTLDSVEIYDPQNNNWTYGPKLPKPLESLSPVKLNKYTHIIEGGGNSTGIISDAYLFVEGNPNKELNVPLISQKNPIWSNQIYDSANLWYPTSPTINNWGCALTSAVMVLNYYGITKLPDKTLINPSTLNDWLRKQKDGYIGNGLLNWLALSRLSKQTKKINKISNYDALEFSKTYTSDLEIARRDIENNIPVILEIPGHFVVAKGVTIDDVKINDPYYQRTLFSQHNNNLISVNKFTPSFTDLSYIMIVVNEPINLELQNENGDKLTEAVKEILLQNDSDASSTNNSNIKTLYFPKPANKKFKIKISSNNASNYDLKIFLYDEQGNVLSSTQKGYIQLNEAKTIPLTFLNRTNFYPKKETIDSLTKDVAVAFAKKQIKSLDLSIEINKLIIKARAEDLLKNRPEQLAIFNKLEELLLSNKEKVSEPAFAKILYDINYLQTHL